MAVISDFDGLLSNAAERFYDDAIEPNTGCLEDFQIVRTRTMQKKSLTTIVTQTMVRKALMLPLMMQ